MTSLLTYLLKSQFWMVQLIEYLHARQYVQYACLIVSTQCTLRFNQLSTQYRLMIDDFTHTGMKEERDFSYIQRLLFSMRYKITLKFL